MSSSAAGPDAVACLERILEAQVRLVELQEAQVRLLERCAPAPPPPPPGEQVAGHGMRPPADGERPTAPPAAAGLREAPPPPARLLGEAAAHGMRAPAEDGDRPSTARAAFDDSATSAEEKRCGEAATAAGRGAAGREAAREAASRLGEELLVGGAWEPEISHLHLVRQDSKHPDRIPAALERFLVVLGLLSPLEISAGWRRFIYRAHRAYIPCSVVLTLVIDAVRMYFLYAVVGADLDMSRIMSQVFSVHGRLFVFLPSFLVWRNQFSPRGAILDLMCFLDERQIPWHQFTSGLHVTWCVSVCGTAFFYSSFLWANREQLLDPGLAVESGVWCLSLLLLLPPFFVFLGSHYLVIFASRLYRHELLCYAGAMVRAMEGDGAAGDVVPSLRKLELLMAARLRHASRTWVRFTVYEIFVAGAWALISAMFLLSGASPTTWLLRLVFTSAIVVVLLAPLASVADTFEYDVVKALNNPSILNGSQKYVGQQLLAHLHSLDWGFRVGGVVIAKSLVSKIATTLGVGVLTTVSSAIKSEFGSAVF